MNGERTRAFFFDRDGIVNVSPGAGYVERWEDFFIQPGFVEALRLARGAGYLAIVVTNQRCIAIGRVARDVVDDIHRRLRLRLAEEYGLDVTDIAVCPHDEGQCDCRKPKPGMLTAAAARWGIDLAGSWMVGDNESDVQAGRAAGCRTIRVGSGKGTSEADILVATADELAVAVRRAIGASRDNDNDCGDDVTIEGKMTW